MSIQTYNPTVKVGNWKENIQLEEDTLKDYLEKRDNGELMTQKNAAWRKKLLAKVSLTISRDKYLHFGNVILLLNLEPDDKSRPTTCLCANVGLGQTSELVGVSCNPTLTSCARSTFTIESTDGSARGDLLRYNQPFCLRITLDGLYLHCDIATFTKSARRSRNNEVMLVTEPSHLTEWIIMPYNPQFRLELEHTPIQANAKIVLTHLKTNQNLHIEKFLLRTQFGREYEASGHSDLDSHRAEKDTNHWVLSMNVPGDELNPISSDPCKRTDSD